MRSAVAGENSHRAKLRNPRARGSDVCGWLRMRSHMRPMDNLPTSPPGRKGRQSLRDSDMAPFGRRDSNAVGRRSRARSSAMWKSPGRKSWPFRSARAVYTMWGRGTLQGRRGDAPKRIRAHDLRTKAERHRRQSYRPIGIIHNQDSTSIPEGRGENSRLTVRGSEMKLDYELLRHILEHIEEATDGQERHTISRETFPDSTIQCVSFDVLAYHFDILCLNEFVAGGSCVLLWVATKSRQISIISISRLRGISSWTVCGIKPCGTISNPKPRNLELKDSRKFPPWPFPCLPIVQNNAPMCHVRDSHPSVQMCTRRYR